MDKLIEKISDDNFRNDQKAKVKIILINGKQTIREHYEKNNGNKLSPGSTLILFRDKDTHSYIS